MPATLVAPHRLDAYVARHPNTGLLSSGHYHSLVFNLDLVGLAGGALLMAEVNAAIGEILDTQELLSLARAAGVIYLPPRKPNVAATITAARLRGD
jgi:hypothetical protein